MAKNRVASIRGTFIKPGLSKNKKLYTRENIGKAVERMSARLSSATDLPLTMYPAHAAADGDNALMTLGRITKVNQEEDGSATFEADIADTSAGRDFAALVNPDNPYVKGLSIRGAWMTEPKVIEYDGESAITGDDLDIFGIDTTHRPGVPGAEITGAKMYESADIANPIFESIESDVFFDEASANETTEETLARRLHEAVDMIAFEEADKTPYGDVAYADPGYQKDKKKRYPIDTAAHVRAAWSYINKGSNASAYTSAQLARIKSKIKSAAKKFNINISEEYDTLVSELESVLEMYASMSISNDAGSISASGYTDDGGKLPAMARRIATATIIGLNALDPDADGDIDLTMPDGSSDSSSSQEAEVPDDNNMESSTCSECGVDMPTDALFCPTCGSPVPNAESQGETEPTTNEEAPVAEETPTAPEAAAPVEAPVVAPVAEAAPAVATITLTTEQFEAILARSAAPAAPAPVAAPVEAAPVVAQTAPVAVDEAAALATLEAEIAQIKEAAKIEAETAAAEAIRASGIIPRTGLVRGQTAGQFNTPTSENLEVKSAKELSEMSEEEVRKYSYETFANQPGWSSVFERADQRAGGSLF